ncbi:hypothetical protein KAFR_0B03080 [Kazachstania africana CBS 2517]|uniref:mRNA export factor MEX67 n=1 Tax=Kazachstania africana (strain ATCC 22294 / BCRC 22015 / CBS 2517 / CECT 1963 / NBRC 1671 / NRRL Y-8276) TaxID=1071382 RepID=H2AQF4_KAZAF|nr:hypothetical protein KAFR_0B03080 [Kazachstania africana CBS 2517]CCF56604.1 hypothetical protein KAFR_0B03080 [Kazachstania africana CBS 2517]
MNRYQNYYNVPSGPQQQFQNQNRVKIGVRNWQNATMQDLLNFLSRNTRVNLMDATIDGPLITGYVQSQSQADQLIKWNGVSFAGNKLKFEIIQGGQTGTSSTIEFLKLFLAKRYDPQARMLNLGGLYDDPELVQKGMFTNMSTQSRMFPAMMKVASKEPGLVVESLNLADNRLKDVSAISALAQTFPHLKNLCLANNQITRINSLDVWKNKFKDLRELLMTNNPITNNPSYKNEMLKIFPKLVVLDNAVVRDGAKLDSIFTLPVKLQIFFFENNELGQRSTDFVTNFLNLWDTDRSQLLSLYSPQSQFSISVDSSVPPSTVAKSDQNSSFGYYIPHSRNISKVSSEKSIQQRLSVGQEQIGNSFKELPRSKHHLQDQPNEYSMQSFIYPQVNGFTITLHGFFDETAKPDILPNKGYNSRNRRSTYTTSANTRLCQKSFERTWVIVPINNTFVVASDMLMIRPYTSHAWTAPSETPQPPSQLQPQIQPPVQAQPQMSPVPVMGAPQLAPTLQLPPDVQSRLNPVQLELLNKLHLNTKLNAEYTFMLAEQSGWNYDVALKGFQDSINNIPRDAFIQ